MTVTISIHGWDWVWLILGVCLGAFLYGFFSAFGSDLVHARKRRTS